MGRAMGGFMVYIIHDETATRLLVTYSIFSQNIDVIYGWLYPFSLEINERKYIFVCYLHSLVNWQNVSLSGALETHLGHKGSTQNRSELHTFGHGSIVCADCGLFDLTANAEETRPLRHNAHYIRDSDYRTCIAAVRLLAWSIAYTQYDRIKIRPIWLLFGDMKQLLQFTNACLLVSSSWIRCTIGGVSMKR